MATNIYIESILSKGPYLPCVSMAGRALLAGYHRHMYYITNGLLRNGVLSHMRLEFGLIYGGGG